MHVIFLLAQYLRISWVSLDDLQDFRWIYMFSFDYSSMEDYHLFLKIQMDFLYNQSKMQTKHTLFISLSL